MNQKEPTEYLSVNINEEDSNQNISSNYFVFRERKEPRSISFVLWIVFFFGLLAGSFYINGKGTSVSDLPDLFFYNSVLTRLQGSGVSVFIASTASSFLFLAAAFILGLTIWGRGAELILPFLRGFGLGMTAGYLYSGIEKGIAFYLLVILPGAVFYVTAIIKASAEGMNFSFRLIRFYKVGNPIRCVPPSVLFFAARIGTIEIYALIGAIIDAVSILLFSGLFQPIGA